MIRGSVELCPVCGDFNFGVTGIIGTPCSC